MPFVMDKSTSRKATSSLLLIKMIEKLERTKYDAYPNKDQTQNPPQTMGGA